MPADILGTIASQLQNPQDRYRLALANSETYQAVASQVISQRQHPLDEIARLGRDPLGGQVALLACREMPEASMRARALETLAGQFSELLGHVANLPISRKRDLAMRNSAKLFLDIQRAISELPQQDTAAPLFALASHTTMLPMDKRLDGLHQMLAAISPFQSLPGFFPALRKCTLSLNQFSPKDRLKALECLLDVVSKLEIAEQRQALAANLRNAVSVMKARPEDLARMNAEITRATGPAIAAPRRRAPPSV